MPFMVNRYACSFCKRFVRADKGKIEQHEKTCFDNESRRACRTCKEEYWDGERMCAKKMLVNTPDEKYKDIGIRWDCRYWEKIENYGKTK